MRTLTSISVAVLVLVTVACSAAPPAPESPDSAVLGIRVIVTPPAGFGSKDSEQVYFARLVTDDPLTQGMVVASSYFDGDYAYLVNAKPGRYVAVASRFDSYGQYTTYLPEKVIKESLTELKPGTVAFMGEYSVGSSMGLDEAEKGQLHYFRLIEPGQSTSNNVLSGFFGSGKYRYQGVPGESKRDEEAQKAFLEAATSELGEYGWGDALNKGQ